MREYSKLKVILHRQFLGNNALTEFLYSRLNDSKLPKNESRDMRHIFISGLARSGTTALLNRIYSSINVGSILYKHMPFVLSPRIATLSTIFNVANSKKRERLHRDNIFISSQSPECLDEVYWIKSNLNSYKSKVLRYSKISNDVLIRYANFLHKFTKYQNKQRLVIKNNNNHIRLEYLSKFFKRANFLILYREPMSHAISLREQHLNFCRIQSKDPFIKEYMDLIGHHEFGLNKKPFVYRDDNDSWYSSNDKKINYWIFQWIETYSYLVNLIKKNNSNILLISYEDLCHNKGLFKKIENSIEINCPPSDLFFKIGKSNSMTVDESYSQKLLKKARDIYSKLNELSFQ